MGSDWCCRCGSGSGNKIPPPPPGVPCAHCSSGKISKCLRVTFAGFGNPPFSDANACGDCTCLNGTTVKIASGGDGSCLWYGSAGAKCFCAGVALSATVIYRSGSPGHYWLQATATFAWGATATYEADLGEDKPDCENFSGVVMTPVSYTNGVCVVAGSSLTVSSTRTDCDHLPRLPYFGAEVCQTCGSTYPSTIYVTLNPLVYTWWWVPPCTQAGCDALEGSYALTQVSIGNCGLGPWDVNTCGFAYTFPTVRCGWAGLNAGICVAGSGANRGVHVSVSLRDVIGTKTEIYRKKLSTGGLANCGSYSGSHCDGFDATCGGFPPDGPNSCVAVYW